MVSAPTLELIDLRQRWPGASADTLAIGHFALAAGEQVFLQGASGSGKSTLLGLLAGLLQPAAGEVRLLGEAFSTRQAAERDRLRAAHIGYIFQQFNLLPYLSVIDNVLLPCRFSASRRARALEGSGALADEAARLLAHLDLPGTLWQRPARLLSIGQQQRVAAARALIGRPGLLLADEPTSALDAGHQAEFLALLRAEAHASGAAMVFVSHDARLASQFGRHLRLHAGRLEDAP